MKNVLINLSIILTILLVISSCEKTSEINPPSNPLLTSRSTMDNLDNMLFETGQIIAQNSSDNSLLESLNDTYGNYCIEEFSLIDFLEILPQGSKYFQPLQELAEENPLITIAFPSFAFFENVSFTQHLSEIEYTVILIDDPEVVSQLPAYNANGELTSISSEFDEATKYCVIKYSENEVAINTNTNTSIFGQIMPNAISGFTPLKSYGDFNIYMGIDVEIAKMMDEGRIEQNFEVDNYAILTLCDDREDDDVDPRGCDEECDRDCPPKTKDELHKLKWSSKKAIKVYESGFHLPSLELYVHYVIPTFVSPTKADVKVVPKYIVGHWKNMTEKWSKPLKLEIQTWDLDKNMSEDWHLTWFERDNWNTVTEKFSIGFNTGGTIDGVEASAKVNYDLSIKKNDKCIGSSIVEYCDDALGEGSAYHPFNYLQDGSDGGFWFREHVKNQ